MEESTARDDTALCFTGQEVPRLPDYFKKNCCSSSGEKNQGIGFQFFQKIVYCMLVNRFSDFNVKFDKGKTPLIVLRCADNRQLFEGTGKGNGKAMKYAIYEGNLDRLEKKLKRIFNKCKA